MGEPVIFDALRVLVVCMGIFMLVLWLEISKQNLILHILTKFHDDDVIQTKIMAILSTGTSRRFRNF